MKKMTIITISLMFLTILISGCTQQKPPEQPENMDSIFNEPELPMEENTSSGYVGYIGCSNTMQTVGAYWLLGGRDLWEFNELKLHEYDGGAVIDWSKGAATGNKFWNTFDRHLEANPNTKTVWWQLCIRKEEPTPYEDAFPVLETIRKKIPGAIVYISPLAEYTDGICEITGAAGIERAKTLAQELDSKNEDVLQGPILGPMSPEDTDEDGCHLSEQGMRTLGEQMKQFFNEKPFSEPTAEDEDLPLEEKVWLERIESALAPSDCPPAVKAEYPSSYYQGPLIDTHLHIPAIPDWPPEDEDSYEEWWPLLGKTVKMTEIACTLYNEGTKKAFAFFPVYPEIPEHMLKIVHGSMQQFPTQFAFFIMPPGPDDVPPTVEADVLREMLSVYPGLFQGYGEIGLYKRENREADDFPPDAPVFQKIYPVIREHNLLVYLHPGEGQEKNLERALQQNPDITFLVHGEEIEPYIGNIMDKHPNIFFTVDDIFVAELYQEYVGKSKEAFLYKLDRNWESLLKKAHLRYAALIESHPDRFMWGTDRGDAAWNYDRDVGLVLVKYARAFIGKLKPEVQEEIAYQNAERLLPG